MTTTIDSKAIVFRVRGIAFIPVQVELLVSADSIEKATAIAEKEFSQSDRQQSFIVAGSEEHCSVFDFRATSAEMELSQDGH